MKELHALKLNSFCNSIRAFEKCEYYKKTRKRGNLELVKCIDERINLLKENYLENVPILLEKSVNHDDNIILNVISRNTGKCLFTHVFILNTPTFRD
jgi:hypothetical protein